MRFRQWVKYICSNNYAEPSLTTRSVGNKLILYPSLTASELDYAICVESSDMFLVLEITLPGINSMLV